MMTTGEYPSISRCPTLFLSRPDRPVREPTTPLAAGSGADRGGDDLRRRLRPLALLGCRRGRRRGGRRRGRRLHLVLRWADHASDDPGGGQGADRRVRIPSSPPRAPHRQRRGRAAAFAGRGNAQGVRLLRVALLRHDGVHAHLVPAPHIQAGPPRYQRQDYRPLPPGHERRRAGAGAGRGGPHLRQRRTGHGGLRRRRGRQRRRLSRGPRGGGWGCEGWRRPRARRRARRVVRHGRHGPPGRGRLDLPDGPLQRGHQPRRRDNLAI
mmetsp:Transcript_37268/g.99215  ORF Transcript_37268/g.99215 Transcript_37268/m.99215 type:complete len:267 (-) Transcript_37268:2683-3483(-)